MVGSEAVGADRKRNGGGGSNWLNKTVPFGVGVNDEVVLVGARWWPMVVGLVCWINLQQTPPLRPAPHKIDRVEIPI
jgi:hypothetical protein